MTADDQKKMVQALHERASLLVGPLGIVVEYEILKNSADLAEFTFKIPDVDKSKPGAYQELIFHFTHHDAHQCKADPSQLDCRPRSWAQLCADYAPRLFDEAKLPNADGVDWRPQETLPEDFYAA
jgi:hypothetical protein